MPTNQQLLDEGTVVDHWPCDIDFETGETASNGSVEALVEYDGRAYIITVNYPMSEVRAPNRVAKEQKQFDLKDGYHITAGDD